MVKEEDTSRNCTKEDSDQMRKHFFSNRIVDHCNSQSEECVNANTIELTYLKKCNWNQTLIVRSYGVFEVIVC